MAAVTVVPRSYKPNAAGALTEKMWKITGLDTNTLDTGIKPVRSIEVFVEPSTITAVTQSTVNGQIRLTFAAAGGAFTATGLLVKYRNG